MAKFALILFVLALFVYCEFDVSMDSAPNLYWSVDGARTEIQQSTPKMSRKLLQPTSSDDDDPSSDGEEDCEGGEWCTSDPDCDGDCTCQQFYKVDGTSIWECEPPSDDDSSDYDPSDDDPSDDDTISDDDLISE